MSFYISAHKRTAKQPKHPATIIKGFNQILSTPAISFLLIAIVTFSLFLPTGFYVLWKNINALDNTWNQSAEISIYLKKNVTTKEASELAEHLKLNNMIVKLELILPNDGMEDFAKHSGFEEILLNFKANPLPSVIVVQPKLGQLSEKQINTLIDTLKNIPEAQAVKMDMDWVMHSHRLLKLWNRLSLILGLILTIGAITTICSASYTAPQIIMDKIKTSKRAVKYQSLWLSLISGLLTISAINFILTLIHNPSISLEGPGNIFSILVVVFGVLLCVTCANFSLSKNINK